MEFDDLSNKLRRNVVVLSFLILISTPLHAQFLGSGSLLGLLAYTKVDGSIFWLLISGVLIYMYLRYWFDKETQKQKSELDVEFELIKTKISELFLEWDIKQSLKKNKEPNWVLNYEDLTIPEIASNNKKWGLPSTVRVELSVDQEQGKLWNGWVLADLEIEWNKKGFYTKHRGNRYQFIFSDWIKKLIWCLTIFKTVVFSKSGIDFLFPNLIAAIALISCLFHIFVTLK